MSKWDNFLKLKKMVILNFSWWKELIIRQRKSVSTLVSDGPQSCSPYALTLPPTHRTVLVADCFLFSCWLSHRSTVWWSLSPNDCIQTRCDSPFIQNVCPCWPCAWCRDANRKQFPASGCPLACESQKLEFYLFRTIWEIAEKMAAR